MNLGKDFQLVSCTPTALGSGGFLRLGERAEQGPGSNTIATGKGPRSQRIDTKVGAILE